jgi:hypothetical protein
MIPVCMEFMHVLLQPLLDVATSGADVDGELTIS